MIFRAGPVVRVSAPPATIHAGRLYIHCSRRPEVTAGQRIDAGDTLVSPTEADPVTRISPMAGTVASIEADRSDSLADMEDEPIHSGKPDVFRIVLEPLAVSTSSTLDIPSPEVMGLHCWLTEMQRTGGWMEGDPANLLPGNSLLRQLALVSRHKPAVVIANGIDAFAPLADHSMLLHSFPKEVVRGLALLAQITDAEKARLIVASTNPAIHDLREAARGCKVQVVVTENRYPSGSPTLLAFHHAGGRRLPHDANPMTQRVLIAQPWALIRIARWVEHGRLDVLRPVLVEQPTEHEPIRCYWAMPGTPLHAIDESLAQHLRSDDHVVLAGHPLTGRALSWHVDDPVGPIVGDRGLSVTIMPRFPADPPQPCISAGWCVDVCPTELLPYRLMRQVEKHPRRRRLLDELQWCVECGLCAHACPSSINIVSTLRDARQRFLRQQTEPTETSA